jgi:S-adenosylmethionine/arginine decarboxylase-like enzyme
MKTYGKELILDLKACDPRVFNRVDISEFFDQLCDRIDMEKGDRHFWDDVGVPPEERQTDPKTKGTSAVQFIITSNITIHTLDMLGTVYLNLFSCKDFDSDEVEEFTRVWFDGEVVKRTEVDRI